MKIIYLTIFFFLWTVHPRLITEVKNLDDSVWLNNPQYYIEENIFTNTKRHKKLNKVTELCYIEAFARMGMKYEKNIK